MRLHELKPGIPSSDEQLCEIFMRSDREYPELSKAHLKAHTDEVNTASPQKIVPLEGGEYELMLTPQKASLFKDGKLVGFMDVTGHLVAGERYSKIEFIYVVSEARGGKALLLMMNGFRSIFKRPILINGAVFKGGVRAIRLLKHRADFRVSVIDLDTGDKSPYNDELINDESKGIVVEGFAWPPYLNYKIGGLDHEVCPKLFEDIDEA